LKHCSEYSVRTSHTKIYFSIRSSAFFFLKIKKALTHFTGYNNTLACRTKPSGGPNVAGMSILVQPLPTDRKLMKIYFPKSYFNRGLHILPACLLNYHAHCNVNSVASLAACDPEHRCTGWGSSRWTHRYLLYPREWHKRSIPILIETIVNETFRSTVCSVMSFSNDYFLVS
jgi:hypothetical protein